MLQAFIRPIRGRGYQGAALQVYLSVVREFGEWLPSSILILEFALKSALQSPFHDMGEVMRAYAPTSA